MSVAFLFDGSVEVRGDEISGERARRLDRIDERGARFARELGHELDHLLRDVAEAHRQGLGFDVFARRLVEAADLRLEVGRVGGDALQADARQALQDEAVVSARVLEGLQNAGGASDGVQIFVVGIVGRGIALGEDGDHRPGQIVDVFDESDRLLTADIEGGDRAREEHRVANGKNGQLVSEYDLLVGPRGHGRVLLLGHVGSPWGAPT